MFEIASTEKRRIDWLGKHRWTARHCCKFDWDWWPWICSSANLLGWAIFSSGAHPSRRGPIRLFLLHYVSLDQQTEAALLINYSFTDALQTHPWISSASFCSEVQCVIISIWIILTPSLVLKLVEVIIWLHWSWESRARFSRSHEG